MSIRTMLQLSLRQDPTTMRAATVHPCNVDGLPPKLLGLIQWRELNVRCAAKGPVQLRPWRVRVALKIRF